MLMIIFFILVSFLILIKWSYNCYITMELICKTNVQSVSNGILNTYLNFKDLIITMTITMITVVLCLISANLMQFIC